MRLVVFGATGRTGRHLVSQALAAHHVVIAFTRTPDLLKVRHDRLKVVQGDVLDREAVARAVEGADAVLVALGLDEHRPSTAVSDGTWNVLLAMARHGVRRVVVLSAAGVLGGDGGRLVRWLVVPFRRHLFADLRRQLEMVRSSDLEWVVVRVPQLLEGAWTRRWKVSLGRPPGRTVSAADAAEFMLRQVHGSEYLRKTPAVSG